MSDSKQLIENEYQENNLYLLKKANTGKKLIIMLNLFPNLINYLFDDRNLHGFKLKEVKQIFNNLDLSYKNCPMDAYGINILLNLCSIYGFSHNFQENLRESIENLNLEVCQELIKFGIIIKFGLSEKNNWYEKNFKKTTDLKFLESVKYMCENYTWSKCNISLMCISENRDQKKLIEFLKKEYINIQREEKKMLDKNEYVRKRDEVLNKFLLLKGNVDENLIKQLLESNLDDDLINIFRKSTVKKSWKEIQISKKNNMKKEFYPDILSKEIEKEKYYIRLNYSGKQKCVKLSENVLKNLLAKVENYTIDFGNFDSESIDEYTLMWILKVIKDGDISSMIRKFNYGRFLNNFLVFLFFLFESKFITEDFYFKIVDDTLDNLEGIPEESYSSNYDVLNKKYLNKSFFEEEHNNTDVKTY